MMPLTERNCVGGRRQSGHHLGYLEKKTTNLGHRTVRLQVGIGGDPKHGEAVQTERDAEVVRDRDVSVTGIARERTVPVGSRRFQDNRDQREEWFDLNVFWGAGGG